ncbi:copper amine oxidase-like protein [Paenibacillus cellulosilyticus]|uniref:Copper amine oxidase-like protein n=1 Tax=Paenibacillus cellulosilyticus TaxID=375489 RepID=A0A2V2YR23_9BACL|nr:copper amine oxidase N-terminal domain-containing protein [Paenibacillus cellulosilyticus]PWV95698.1 copper amine oxidase-like protein [Paenibacillus cellulosilyticus]QKS47667.1 copper amine oxidase N-terminal domain-containing protein [Paenibacillus cellulosilyticus]
MNDKLKIAAAVICLGGAFTAVSYASDLVQAHLSNGAIYINNEKKELPSGQSVMNVNGSTYVPIRFISEQLHNIVGYDAQSKSVYIDDNQIRYNKSTVTQSDQTEQFKLKLSSAKTRYAEGEPLNVWASLTSLSKEELTIHHGGALILYYIRGADGTEASLLDPQMLVTETFQYDNERLESMPQELLISYNLNRLHSDDLDTYMRTTPRPAALPKGKYVIGAVSSYSLNEDNMIDTKQELVAELEIEVE